MQDLPNLITQGSVLSAAAALPAAGSAAESAARSG
jgi:hypothetical protein